MKKSVKLREERGERRVALRRKPHSHLSSLHSPLKNTLLSQLSTLLLLTLLASCRPTQYVPVETVAVRTDTVETVRTDTLWREAQAARRDSILRSDTIYIKEYVRETVDTAGRVLRTDRELERTVVRQQESYTALLSAYRELEKTSRQLREVSRDSASTAVPVPVPAELTRWQRIKMQAGGFGIGAAIGLLLAGLAFIIIKIRKA